MTWRRVEFSVLILLVWLFALLPRPARADSWSNPHELTAPSANGQFMARTQPASATQPASLRVSRKDGAPLWQAQLTNKVSPVEVMITDDGEGVITFDNWGQVGYGDDVLAFYGRKGQLTRYSLEQILGVEKVALDDPSVSLSVSSRWWRPHGITFL